MGSAVLWRMPQQVYPGSRRSYFRISSWYALMIFPLLPPVLRVSWVSRVCFPSDWWYQLYDEIWPTRTCLGGTATHTAQMTHAACAKSASDGIITLNQLCQCSVDQAGSFCLVEVDCIISGLDRFYLPIFQSGEMSISGATSTRGFYCALRDVTTIFSRIQKKLS